MENKNTNAATQDSAQPHKRRVRYKGTHPRKFSEKYNHQIDEYFDIKKLLIEGKLILKDNHLKIADEYLYLSNDILINFIGE